MAGYKRWKHHISVGPESSLGHWDFFSPQNSAGDKDLRFTVKQTLGFSH